MDVGNTDECKCDVELVADQFERCADTRFARRRETVEMRPAEQNRSRSKRTGLEDSCPLRTPPSIKISPRLERPSAIRGSIEMVDTVSSSQ